MGIARLFISSLLLSGLIAGGVARAIEPNDPVTPAPPPDRRVAKNTTGFLNEYHRTHAGQIAFSKSPIERKTPPTNPVSSFAANDKIFARVYLGDSAENLQVMNGKKCRDDERGYDRTFEAYVGAERIILESVDINGELSHIDTSFSFTEGGDARSHLVALFDGTPMPKDHPDDRVRYNYLNQLVPLLKDGDNRIRFVARLRCNMDNDTSFVGADAQVTIRMSPAIRAALGKAASSPMAKSVLPPRMDPFMKAAVNPYFNHKYAVAAVAATGKWDIEYHPINGRPVLRKIDGQAFLRGFDGDHCAWINVTYEQRALSGGRYTDQMEAYVPAGDPTPILCTALPRK
jgi:hypothetical protein